MMPAPSGGPDQGARAAERHHEERLHRGHELHVGGADEAVVVGPEHAGHAREDARDHEGEILVQPHVVAEGLACGTRCSRMPLQAEAEGRA